MLFYKRGGNLTLCVQEGSGCYVLGICSAGTTWLLILRAFRPTSGISSEVFNLWVVLTLLRRDNFPPFLFCQQTSAFFCLAFVFVFLRQDFLCSSSCPGTCSLLCGPGWPGFARLCLLSVGIRGLCHSHRNNLNK